MIGDGVMVQELRGRAAVRMLISATLTLATVATSAVADQPGRGLVSVVEQQYLKFIIDHHYSALRITELAAGTDVMRDAALDPAEGTSPTPGTSVVSAKAHSADLRSMARRENRTQREEIQEARGFLKNWYGVDYEPRLRSMGKAQIALLEKTPGGEQFDHLYMEVLARHHYAAIVPSTACQVSADVEHEPLRRYCSGVVHMQISEIDTLREMLCDRFSVCDYLPLVGIKGRHSGRDGEQLVDVPADEP